MARAQIVGKQEARKKALACIDQLEANFGRRLKEIVEEIDPMIKALTPVNTGQAVRNYIWTTGAPNPIVFDAIDNGPPGHTNSMSLGSEPRRGPNEDAAHATLLALNFSNPFQTFYLTNLSPDIGGLELGILPGPPFKSRSPNGMFGIVQNYIAIQIAAKGMLK